MPQLTNAWFALVNHFFNDKSCIITCNKSVTLLFPGLSHDSIVQARKRGILTLAVRKNSPKNDGTVRGAGSLSLLRVGRCGLTAMYASDTKQVSWLRGQDPTSPESKG